RLTARKAVSMTSARFYYWNGDWDLKQKTETNPNGDFETKKLRYLLCVLQGPNPSAGQEFYSAAMDVRYFGPDKQPKKSTLVGASAPPGQADWVAFSGWGNEKPGSFSKGEWTVEVWCQGQNLRQLHFRVR